MNQEKVRKLFNYDVLLGDLVWIKPKNGVILGRAGGMQNDGRRHITVEGKSYRNDALIWLWHYGILPKALQQKDGKKLNIRIENLKR